MKPLFLWRGGAAAGLVQPRFAVPPGGGGAVAGGATVVPQSGSPSGANSNSALALGYCVLLALQFGLQPTLVKAFTPDVISKKTIVITTEVSKILITLVSIFVGESKAERSKIFGTWTIKDSLKQAAVPAILYALQNVLTQYGMKMLDSMTFNLLNQTKILTSAFCLWIVLKQKQSARQVFALLILLQAAVLLSLPKDLLQTVAEASFAIVPTITTHLRNSDFINAFHASISVPRQFFGSLFTSAFSAKAAVSSATYRTGVLMVVGASAISGVCAALTQRSLQQSKRHALFYSAEMAVYGILALLVSSIRVYGTQGGGLALDYASGLGELTRGVELQHVTVWDRSPAWVLVPIIVNVSRAAFSSSSSSSSSSVSSSATLTLPSSPRPSPRLSAVLLWVW